MTHMADGQGLPKPPRSQRRRSLIMGAVVLLGVALLYLARRALLPFAIGTFLAYLVSPAVNGIGTRLPAGLRGRRSWRGLVVIAVYTLSLIGLALFLAWIVPPIGTEIGGLVQRFPELGRKIYEVAPDAIRTLLTTYRETVPPEIQQVLDRNLQNVVPSLLSLLQSGISTTLDIALSTLSFTLGLIVVPLWMFYILRDQHDMTRTFYALVPAALREDVRSVLVLADAVLGSYLRGQVLLCLSVGAMVTAGLLFLRVDFALLLGTIAGIFEVLPVLGPILGAIPAVLVALATSPSNAVWVVVLAIAVQQLQNLFLVPQVQGMTVRLHPAIVMLVMIVGSEVAGVAGVILSVPLTAMFRDVGSYLYMRLADQSLPPAEARARLLRTQ
jgi:predicted PurR-regulated permease PerM